MVQIEPLGFEHLAAFEGLSRRSIREHIGLYHGYVHKYNELTEKLRAVFCVPEKRACGRRHGEFEGGHHFHAGGDQEP